MRQRAVEGPAELDDEATGALGGERVDEPLLTLRLFAGAKSGREDEFAAPEEVGGVLDIEHVDPAHVAAERVVARDDLGETAAQCREFEDLGDRDAPCVIDGPRRLTAGVSGEVTG